MEWNDYFMNIAQVVKTKSKDTKVKVGAVLVSLKDHRIISTGYNGLPAGCNDDIDWKDREHVRSVIIHAEMNCLLYAQSKFDSSILYCTMSPCKDCIKILAASKIKKIIYCDEYRDIPEVKKICKIFDIEIIQYNNILEE